MSGGWRSPDMPHRYARRETAEEGPVAKHFRAVCSINRHAVAKFQLGRRETAAERVNSR